VIIGELITTQYVDFLVHISQIGWSIIPDLLEQGFGVGGAVSKKKKKKKKKNIFFGFGGKRKKKKKKKK